MKMSSVWASIALVCGSVLVATDSARAAGLEAAVARSQATGLPLLVVGSSPS